MRLIYPTDEDMGYLSKRGAHFGKAKFYTIVTLQEKSISNVEVIKNPGHDNGGCSDAVANIMQLSPDALIVSGIGGSPAQKFAAEGLEIFFDKTAATVLDSITAFTQGTLPKVNGGTCKAH